ncbi:hypothetical protein NIES22_67450 [Calothrix brevissima NIES-22]|nr:hypothetical protein NIES22_67450 [Calothrix brevissima NIES-22]
MIQPQVIDPIPEETVRVARAAFLKGNLYMTMRDEIGTLYNDQDFEDLFPTLGQPAFSPWRLALVCVMQYIEDMTDRQAADAVRSRIDWKYALSLELTDPGFDFSVLCEFRVRLISGSAEQKLLDILLKQFKEKGIIKDRGKQRTDSTHVLAAIRNLNRLESVAETLRAALNAVATVNPEWLRSWVPHEWKERYNTRAGVEGTLSQGINAFGLRQARYRNLPKVRLQHQITAVAINVVRMVSWLNGIPHATTRTSRFAALAVT